jgi:RNase H-like protein
VLGPGRLGWDRRDDLDAAVIPQIYFDYLRGGPPERLTSVFRHNQMDLRGLAGLTGRIFALLSEPEALSDDEIHALELYGLSRLLLRRGEASKARLLYQRALGAGLPAATARTARRELARLAKRERDFARANALWEDLLQVKMGAASFGSAQDKSSAPTSEIAARRILSECAGAQHAVPLRPDYETASSSSDSGLDTVLEAYEQLAIYYEHRAREPARAAGLTREALARLRSGLRARRLEPGRYRRWQARLEHRLARLMRRTQPEDRRPLFEPASVEAVSHPRESNREAARGEKHPRTRRI